MIRLAEEVARRGGQPEDPLVYKQMYLDRLMQRIAGRREGLSNGRISPAKCLSVFVGTARRPQATGRNHVRASGTDEPHVLDEVRLLGLDRYFGRHVYGAKDDYRTFSKAHVIERILRENNLGANRSWASATATSRSATSRPWAASPWRRQRRGRRSGKPDPWKRDRLVGAGADVVIPDYHDWRSW